MEKEPVVQVGELEGSTRYAPLVAIGHYVRKTDAMGALRRGVLIERRSSKHQASDSLVDVWLSIMANCRSIVQANTKLRPETTLARSWGRKHGFAEQSTMARVLDGMKAEQVEQVRQAVMQISRGFSASRQHDWSQPLLVDIDLTAMPASARAQGSSKGYFHEKGGAAASCDASG